jgi:hypothetical protein
MSGTPRTSSRLARKVSLALALALLAMPAWPGTAASSVCSRTSVGLTPLSDLGAGSYRGSKGGLYPGSVDFRPVAHEREGEAIAEGIGPLAPDGTPNPQGKYALLSIGMSNTTIEFRAFRQLVGRDPANDPHLVIVDGAQSGVTGTQWADPRDPAWAAVNSRLSVLGVTPQQVAVAWVKVADAHPTSGWPSYAMALESDMASIAHNLHAKFPNLRIAYYSSRTYGGYASTSLNPEPYAYQSGFSVKWLVRDQIDGQAALNSDPAEGPVRAPWLSWGPYLWADGLTPRSDGLTWACSDFVADGTHPSQAGASKVAGLLRDFFHTDSTARPWFLASSHKAMHVRHISIGISPTFVATGAITVSDGFGACIQQAEVDVQRHRHGRWVKVATTTTGKHGHYRVPIPAASGTYRAHAPGFRMAGPGSDVCRAANAAAVPAAAAR